MLGLNNKLEKRKMKNEQLSLLDVDLYAENTQNSDITKENKDKEVISSKLIQEKPNLAIKQTLRVLSLFSGCGGMDIGFEGGFSCLKQSINTSIHPNWIEKDNGKWVELANTGFKTVFANDIRPDAKAAWVSYFEQSNPNANEIYHLDSIVDLVKKAKEGNPIFPENIDVVTGGFPCQDFSIAGKRKGFNSEKSHSGGKLQIGEPTEESRGQLYMWMREVVSIVKPSMFVAENVKGLTSFQDAKTIIEHDFENAADGGYLVIPARVLHAANFGVPQSRERVIFYGFKRSNLNQKALEALSDLPKYPDYDPYPIPTHAFTVKDNKLSPFVTCRNALIDLEEPTDVLYSKDPSQMKYSKAKFLKKGQGNVEIKLDYISPTIRSEHHGNIEYRRLSEANGGMHKEELLQGLPERRLTIRECARLQTFPDNYQFILTPKANNVSVSASEAYKIIGNAVPCLLGYNIAMRLKENWERYFLR